MKILDHILNSTNRIIFYYTEFKYFNNNVIYHERALVSPPFEYLHYTLLRKINFHLITRFFFSSQFQGLAGFIHAIAQELSNSLVRWVSSETHSKWLLIFHGWSRGDFSSNQRNAIVPWNYRTFWVHRCDISLRCICVWMRWQLQSH